jgi:hypothetical protein
MTFARGSEAFRLLAASNFPAFSLLTEVEITVHGPQRVSAGFRIRCRVRKDIGWL